MGIKSIAKKFTLAALMGTTLLAGTGAGIVAAQAAEQSAPATLEEAIQECKANFDPLSAGKKGALIGGGIGIIADKTLRGIILGGGGMAGIAKYKQVQCINEKHKQFGVEPPASSGVEGAIKDVIEKAKKVKPIDKNSPIRNNPNAMGSYRRS